LQLTPTTSSTSLTVCRNQRHESLQKSRRGSHTYKSNLEYRMVRVNPYSLILPVWDFVLDTKSSTTYTSVAFWAVLYWASCILYLSPMIFGITLWVSAPNTSTGNNK
jgi:hypothetical protein